MRGKYNYSNITDPSDYVVEAVAENGWTCRKWASGWCECFTTFHTTAGPTNAGQHINYRIAKPSILVATRTGNCNIEVTAETTPYLAHANMGASPIDIWICTPRALAETRDVYLFISLYGYWRVQ